MRVDKVDRTLVRQKPNDCVWLAPLNRLSARVYRGRARSPRAFSIGQVGASGQRNATDEKPAERFLEARYLRD